MKRIILCLSLVLLLACAPSQASQPISNSNAGPNLAIAGGAVLAVFSGVALATIPLHIRAKEALNTKSLEEIRQESILLHSAAKNIAGNPHAYTRKNIQSTKKLCYVLVGMGAGIATLGWLSRK